MVRTPLRKSTTARFMIRVMDTLSTVRALYLTEARKTVVLPNIARREVKRDQQMARTRPGGEKGAYSHALSEVPLLSNTDVLNPDVLVRVGTSDVGPKGIVTGTRSGSTMSAMLDRTSVWVVITMLESTSV